MHHDGGGCLLDVLLQIGCIFLGVLLIILTIMLISIAATS